MGIPPTQFMDDSECGIFLMAGAEYDFESWIILPEETLQIVLQHRLHPVQWLQDGHEGPGGFASGLIPRLFPKAPCGFQHEDQINRARDQSQKGKIEEQANHEPP